MKHGAFNQGDTPTIAVFNKAKTPLDADLGKMTAALQAYVDSFVEPRWDTPCKLIQSTDFVKGAWALAFYDDADYAGALAYHELTPDGLPLSKVFVRTILKSHSGPLSWSASHELVEMLVDPAINMYTTGPNRNWMYAYESADPVEALGFDVQGFFMSDFVYPSYFEAFRKAGSVKFDEMGKVSRPFQILSGGYQIIWDGRRWRNIFGSKRKETAFGKEDRRGHRSELRKQAQEK
jgi:hypothetical protein